MKWRLLFAKKDASLEDLALLKEGIADEKEGYKYWNKVAECMDKLGKAEYAEHSRRLAGQENEHLEFVQRIFSELSE